MGLFVQRMRRTEKKEEVEKRGFEHTSRATPQRVAGMTEITRVAGLSCGAAKGQRARALASPLNCTEQQAQDPFYPPLWDGCVRMERCIPVRHIMTLYIRG